MRIKDHVWNRPDLAKHYFHVALKEIRAGRMGNGRSYGRVAAHHAIEAARVEKGMGLRRKVENAYTNSLMKRIRPGDCYCEVG